MVVLLLLWRGKRREQGPEWQARRSNKAATLGCACLGAAPDGKVCANSGPGRYTKHDDTSRYLAGRPLTAAANSQLALGSSGPAHSCVQILGRKRLSGSRALCHAQWGVHTHTHGEQKACQCLPCTHRLHRAPGAAALTGCKGAR
jgi:hypothetical protein